MLFVLFISVLPAMTSPSAQTGLTGKQLLDHLSQYDRASVQDKCALSPTRIYHADAGNRSGVNALFWWAAALDIGSRYGISEEGSAVSAPLGLGPMESKPGRYVRSLPPMIDVWLMQIRMSVPVVPSALWTSESPDHDGHDAPHVIMATYLLAQRPDLAIDAGDAGFLGREILKQTRRAQIAAAKTLVHGEQGAWYSEIYKHTIGTTTTTSSGPPAPGPVTKSIRKVHKKTAKGPPTGSLRSRYRTRGVAAQLATFRSGELFSWHTRGCNSPQESISIVEESDDEQTLGPQPSDSSTTVRQSMSPVNESCGPGLDISSISTPDLPVPDALRDVTAQIGQASEDQALDFRRRRTRRYWDEPEDDMVRTPCVPITGCGR